MSKKRAEDSEAEENPTESVYSAEYLMECADEEARQERLEELKRRIALGAYRIDSDSIAEQMLGRVDLGDD